MVGSSICWSGRVLASMLDWWQGTMIEQQSLLESAHSDLGAEQRLTHGWHSHTETLEMGRGLQSILAQFSHISLRQRLPCRQTPLPAALSPPSPGPCRPSAHPDFNFHLHPAPFVISRHTPTISLPILKTLQFSRQTTNPAVIQPQARPPPSRRCSVVALPICALLRAQPGIQSPSPLPFVMV